MNKGKQNESNEDAETPETLFSRASLIKKIKEQNDWDIIVIGGGATGLGIAVDAASRGFSTLLLEQADFAKGTSSRSTKLVHGGVRYLAQGNIKLVYDALRERGILLKNAAHLVKRQAFIIPCYSIWSELKYLAGLKIYDWLSGSFSFGRSEHLNRNKLLKAMPDIKSKGLRGGIQYFDGQFDDARLAINLARTAVENGAVVLNYCKVTALVKTHGRISGVSATDIERKEKYVLNAKVVINATGVFVDDILQMDSPEKRPLVRSSQGVHLVMDKAFLNGNAALMIPETADGRVLFAVPWHDHVLVGTTDTPLDNHSIEPKALQKEIDFILGTVKQYFSRPPGKKDILSVFAGLRPLAAPQKDTDSTKEISRDHKLLVSDSKLITITGGKWTTYRKMAEETVNKAIETAGLKAVPCKTKELRIHGCSTSPQEDHLSVYGSDAVFIQKILQDEPRSAAVLNKNLPYTEAEVLWAVRHEMARTIEDVLARRLRILFLDARAAISSAPRVAELMAKELGRDEEWKRSQIMDFVSLANQYLLQPDSIAAVTNEPANEKDRIVF